MKHIIKSTLLLILLTLSTGNSYAKMQEQAYIDSLLRELPSQKEDTNKVNVLDDLSAAYIAISPDDGIKYGKQCLELATKLDWKKGMAWAYGRIGDNYRCKSDYPKALEYFLKALKLGEDIGDKHCVAAVTCNIGIIYDRQGDYPKALAYFFSALKLDEEGGYKRFAAAVTCNIGNIYSKQSEYPKALEYFFKALKLAEELGNKKGIAITISNIGNAYYAQKEYPKSLEYLLKALKLVEGVGDKGGVTLITSNIGVIYNEQKNYLMAIEYYQSALKMAEELGDKDLMAYNLGNIGATYISIIKDTTAKGSRGPVSNDQPKGAYESHTSIPKGKAALLTGAIDYYKRALGINKEIGTIAGMQSCYAGLSEAYKLKGDYRQSMEYQASYQAIKDSIFSQDNKAQIVKLEMKDQYGRQRLTDSLKTEAREKITAIRLQKQKAYTGLGIAGIMLLAGFSFFIVKERRKSEKERGKSDELLLNILPAEVAQELKMHGSSEAKDFDNVTVLFTDFVNFTSAGERMNAKGLVDELHNCFKAFDEITHKYGIEKIKTIGDAYLAVGGLPTADSNHAENTVKAAKEINQFMADRLSKLGRERTFEIRIGIHSGSVVAGIVGIKKFAYDIWGDTVNTAARMEQNCEAGKINISATTYELVKYKINCEYRGAIEAKGKGMLKMYYVTPSN